MLEVEVLVSELLAVDGLAASTVTGSEVTTLEHEVRDHTVEARALVAEALLASAESTEVGGSLGDDTAYKLEHVLVKELELDGAKGSTVLGNVKENVGHVE